METRPREECLACSNSLSYNHAEAVGANVNKGSPFSMVNCQIMFIYVICTDMLYKWRLFPCDSKQHQAPGDIYHIIIIFLLFTFGLSYCFAPKHLAKIRTTLLNDVNCLFKMRPIKILTCLRGSTDVMSTKCLHFLSHEIHLYIFIDAQNQAPL